MASQICEEQRKLEEVEDDIRSEEGSPNEDLLDESMEEEDDHREPAITRSASKAAVIDLSALRATPLGGSAAAPNPVPSLLQATPQGGMVAQVEHIPAVTPA